MRKIWDDSIGEHIEMPKSMKDFLEDIVAVYKKHGLSISHEDSGGAFIVEEYKEYNIEWLYEAFKYYKEEAQEDV
jgi:hypothetical protein